MCGGLAVDVNGNKGPNNYGRDEFWFYITNGRGPKLYPVGGLDDGLNGSWTKAIISVAYGEEPTYYSSPVCSKDNVKGALCAGRVIEEGWQMNY